MIVTVDTNILIWGVRHTSIPSQADMIPRATAFLQWIDKQGHKLVVTSACISEYLVGATEDDMARELKQLSAKYKIIPFDTNAAVHAARIRSDREFLRQLKDAGKTNVAIKADIVIVATAKAHNVDRIYSFDETDIPPIAARCGLSYAPLPTLADLTPIHPSSIPRASREASMFGPEDEPE
jgi:predicted nucleic acid-binding protein